MINLKTILGFNSFISSSDKLLNLDLCFSTDNRDLDDEKIFIAIIGNKYNPLKDLKKVLDSDCRFVVFEDSPENNILAEEYEKFLVYIRVESITKFIEEAGRAIGNTFRTNGGVIIAISGSNGKTTTKEMLYHILNEELVPGEVICTQKNNNNNLGVPFTLFQRRKNTRYAIVEVGSNHPGEIELLSKMLRPKYAITTNVGDTHLEFFETRENVLKEELEISNHTTNLFFKNMDDPLISTQDIKKSKTFGFKGDDYIFKKIDSGISVNGIEITNSKITGVHSFYNLAVAASMASEILNDDLEEFVCFANSFIPTANRSQWVDYKEQKVFLDAYNANPSSMLVAIDAFAEHLKANDVKQQDSALVIGDMNELGPNAAKFHKVLGNDLNKYSFGMIIFVGRFGEEVKSAYKGSLKTFLETSQAKENFDEHVAQFKFLLFKGSRSLQLETILDIR